MRYRFNYFKNELQFWKRFKDSLVLLNLLIFVHIKNYLLHITEILYNIYVYYSKLQINNKKEKQIT